MKKTPIIIIAVIAAVAATYWADKATRVGAKGRPNGAVSASDKPLNIPAPVITLKNLDGQDVSLNQFKGQVVLVNFWATWCDPCRVEIPWLIDMQRRYASKGFTVLGISMDEEGKSVVAPFVATERFDVNGQKLPMSYPILIGNDAAADKFGGLLGYPTSVLISRDGKQIKRITGLISYDEIAKIIESQL